MTIPLELKLRKLTKKWRQTGQNVRIVAGEMPNLLARGHLHGMSDALDVAAEDVEEALNSDVPPK